jgi:hypothetical protein
LSTAQQENLDAISPQSVQPPPADVTVTWINVISELALGTAGAVTLTVRDVVDRPVVAR